MTHHTQPLPAPRAARIAALLAAALGAAGLARADAGGPRPDEVTPPRPLTTVGRVWIEGDSTLHRYRAEARALSASVRNAPVELVEVGLPGLLLAWAGRSRSERVFLRQDQI